MRRFPVSLTALALTIILPGSPARAQHAELFGNATQIVLPQARCFALHPVQQGVTIQHVTASVRIVEQTASTTLDIALLNHEPRQEQAVLLLPVPEGAVVSGFDFQGQASEPTARVLPADEARRTYDGLVAKIKDPALLEFAGYRMVRSSVFPVPPHGTQRVRLTYEHLLERDGERIDYVLPRSESLERQRPWTIDVDVRMSQPIATAYCPSHQTTMNRTAPGRLTIDVTESARRAPGPFRLSLLMERNGLSASMLAYPDPSIGGGYFLLMAGVAPRGDDQPAVSREVTIVIDRSGSMAGPKMDQVRAAALQVIEGLADGEAFNIIDYATTVSSFTAAPIVKSRTSTLEARQYLTSLRPSGGTNIHDALVEALRQPSQPGRLPIVLFLTDGLPTIGRTSEVQIREMVAAGNAHKRRIFTFGVGEDVNVPLLDRLATSTRATSAYVLPHEDVELAVARVFRRLQGPVLTAPQLTVTDTSGAVTTRRVHDLIPDPLPDLFDGDQLILLGKYRGDDPIAFDVAGDYRGARRSFQFTFDLAGASTRNSFVPRLWASRRIAFLVDQIRQAGANDQPWMTTTPAAHPQLRELVEEIMRLSTEFGILTEYTAFLATEGTDLTAWRDNVVGCSTNLNERAMKSRSGRAAVTQSYNNYALADQEVLNSLNVMFDDNLEEVSYNTVQQVNDRAFFRRGRQWIDSRIAVTAPQPDVTITIGSPEHLKLLHELIAENRQGVISLSGDILLRHNGRVILIKNDGC